MFATFFGLKPAFCFCCFVDEFFGYMQESRALRTQVDWNLPSTFWSPDLPNTSLLEIWRYTCRILATSFWAGTIGLLKSWREQDTRTECDMFAKLSPLRSWWNTDRKKHIGNQSRRIVAFWANKKCRLNLSHPNM